MANIVASLTIAVIIRYLSYTATILRGTSAIFEEKVPTWPSLDILDFRSDIRPEDHVFTSKAFDNGTATTSEDGHQGMYKIHKSTN